MTKEEVIAGLKKAARLSLDIAVGNEVVVEHFMPEYEKGITGNPEASKETNDRSHELYWTVIEKRREAERFREEADLFLAAVELLEESNG